MNYKSLTFPLVALVIGALLGFSIGYAYGNQQALNWCFEKGINFLELKGIMVEIDLNRLSSSMKHYLSHTLPIPQINYSI